MPSFNSETDKLALFIALCSSEQDGPGISSATEELSARQNTKHSVKIQYKLPYFYSLIFLIYITCTHLFNTDITCNDCDTITAKPRFTVKQIGELSNKCSYKKAKFRLQLPDIDESFLKTGYKNPLCYCKLSVLHIQT